MSTACRDSVEVGSTSTVTPRTLSQPAGAIISASTVIAIPIETHGERITRAIVVFQPVPLPAEAEPRAQVPAVEMPVQQHEHDGQEEEPGDDRGRGDDHDRDGDRADHHHREQGEHAPSSARA